MYTFVKHTDNGDEVTWDLSELRLLKAWKRAYSRFLRYIVPTLLLNDTQRATVKSSHRSSYMSLNDNGSNHDQFICNNSAQMRQTISVLRCEYPNLDLNVTEDRVSESGVLIPGLCKKQSTMISRMNLSVVASSKHLLTGSVANVSEHKFNSNNKLPSENSQPTLLIGASSSSTLLAEDSGGKSGGSGGSSYDDSNKTPDIQKAKGRFIANEAPLIKDEDPCSPGRYNISHKPSNVNAVDSMKNNINSNDSGRDSEFSPDWTTRSSVKKGFTSSTNGTTQKVVPGIIVDDVCRVVGPKRDNDHEEGGGEDTVDGEILTATATATVVDESSFHAESSP